MMRDDKMKITLSESDIQKIINKTVEWIFGVNNKGVNNKCINFY